LTGLITLAGPGCDGQVAHLWLIDTGHWVGAVAARPELAGIYACKQRMKTCSMKHETNAKLEKGSFTASGCT
jgi:hypothetical protein